MSVVDSLELQISAESQKANAAIDSIIRNLGRLGNALKLDTSSIANIGKNLDFSKITDGAKTMSETVGKAGVTMAQSMKPVQEETKKIARTFEQVKDPFKDLGKGFRIEGTISDIQKAVQRYTNELERAKLKEQTLSAKGMTNTKSYENAVADVVKYENVLESLKNQLEEIRTIKPQVDFKIQGVDEAEQTLDSFKKDLAQFSEMIDAGGVETEAGIKFPVRGLEMSLEQLRSMYPEAKELISSYEAEIDRAKELSSDVSFQKIQPIDLSAFEQIGEKTRTASEQLREFREKLSQLEVPEIRETNLEKLRSSLEKTEQKLDELRTKLANSLTMGNITESVDDRGFVRLQEQIALTEKQAEALRQKIAEIGNAPEIGNISGFERLKQSISGLSASIKTANKASSTLYATLKKLNSGVNSIFAKIGKLTKSMFSLGEAAKISGKGFDLNLKTILKYGFGIRSVYMLVNKLRNAIKEGMKNIVQYSDETNQSVSMLVSSIATLKNASAAAVSPLLNAIAPALNQLIQLFIRATNAVNQFFAALMGKSTWIKAKDQITDYADSISKASDAAKGALQPFDKLNNLTTQKAAGGGVNAEDMFETLPIADKFKDIADKIKEILSKLFAPLKEAWNREGKFVMDSWKYALDEVWKLIKDIGRDFLEVWQQEKTIKIFEDILHIIGDIGLAIGHLARNFRDAWNENETGLHILENIRDIIGVIISNIREAADKTVEWADKLNFTPLLEAFERFTESLIPVADALSGILTDFYTEVLLPLSKWTIEKGLPELLDVFTAFNEKVDWKSLRDNLAEFWKHLEPFAETVGEGLIIFIQRVSDALADFVNSQEFKDFLAMIEDWMDSVTPEDVADALEKIAKALIALKLAVLGFGAISAMTGILTTIKTFLSFFGVGGSGATAAKGIEGTTTAIGGLTDALGILKTTLGAGLVFDLGIKNKEIDALEKITGDTETADKMRERYGSLGGTVNILKDSFSVLRNAIMGYGAEVDGVEGKERALAKAMEDTSNGRIMSDKNLEVLQSRFKATSEDIEMLRQNMLDVHPEIRNIADSFDFLGDASAQSLREIYEGLKYADSGISSTDEIAHKLVSTFGQDVTPTTKNFFDAWFESSGRLSDSFYEFQTGEQVIDGYVTSLKDASGAIEQFGDDITAASTNIGEGLTAGMEKVDTDSPASGFFSKFVASIKSVFGIHSPATTMEPFGENILLGVLEGFKSKFDAFTAPIQQLCNSITQKISNGLQNMRNTWSNIWNALPSVVTGVINKITSSLSTLVSNISKAFSSISSRIKGIGSAISGASSGGRSYSMPNISTSNINLPKFGKGAVVTRYTEAVVGENGTEGIIPLTDHRAMKMIADGIMSQYQGTGVYGSEGYQANSQSESLLRTLIQKNEEQNQILRAILDKEFGITTDQVGKMAQDYSQEYYKRNGRYAYS